MRQRSLDEDKAPATADLDVELRDLAVHDKALGIA